MSFDGYMPVLARVNNISIGDVHSIVTDMLYHVMVDQRLLKFKEIELLVLSKFCNDSDVIVSALNKYKALLFPWTIESEPLKDLPDVRGITEEMKGILNENELEQLRKIEESINAIQS